MNRDFAHKLIILLLLTVNITILSCENKPEIEGYIVNIENIYLEGNYLSPYHGNLLLFTIKDQYGQKGVYGISEKEFYYTLKYYKQLYKYDINDLTRFPVKVSYKRHAISFVTTVIIPHHEGYFFPIEKIELRY